MTGRCRPEVAIQRAVPLSTVANEPSPFEIWQRNKHAAEDDQQVTSGTEGRLDDPTYAIQPVWGDGHATGLFSFEYLRQVADSN